MSSNSKRIQFDFFRVELSGNDKSFEGLLEAAQKITDLEARAQRINETIVRWEYLDKTPDGNWVGDMTRMRNDVVPNRASPKKPRTRLQLSADEATTEDTVFAYFPALNVLVVHSNRYGMSGFNIANYFGRLSKVVVLDTPIVMALAAKERLSKFSYYEKFKIKVALPKRGPLPLVGDVSTDTALELAKEVGAKYAEIELSVGNSINKMDTGKINAILSGAKTIFDSISKKQHQPIRSLFVSGRTDEDHRVELDLLSERLRAEESVDVTPDRDIPYDSRRTAVLRAFVSCKAELELQFAAEQ